MLAVACQVQADTVWESGHHEINDGDLYGEIWMHNDCTLDILGGDIFRLAAYDTTVTDWYDGVMDVLWARGDSIINIYGGGITLLSAIDSSIVNLYAYDVIHTYTGGIYDEGQVMGKYLLDDTAFCFDLPNSGTFSHINVIPEPTTLVLLGLGFLALRKRN
jgi:hypothetical protein